MSDTKQTAVEWYINEMDAHNKGESPFTLKQIKHEALAMEREQIIEARVSAPLLPCSDKETYIVEAEQYYTDTYGK